MAENPTPNLDSAAERERKERREFLRRCGRFAIVTPPAMTTLLTVSSIPREAHASTIGRRSPGKSGKSPPGNGWGLFGDD